MPIGFAVPFKSIQMVLEGPLIHHLQGFVLAVLPFGKIQTMFCISWPTIQNHLGNQHCTHYTVISPFKTTIANGFKWCINLYEKGTKSRRVKSAFFKGLYLQKYKSDLVETWHVHRQGHVISENWSDVIMTSSFDFKISFRLTLLLRKNRFKT